MVVLLGSLTGCGAATDPSAEAAGGPGAWGGGSVADAQLVAAGDEGDFEDLGDVEGFDQLSSPFREAAVERANLTRCDCGCQRHSVNHCLHQSEVCDVALRLARGFVDDALAYQLQVIGATPTPARGGSEAGGEDAAAEEPADEPVEEPENDIDPETTGEPDEGTP